MSPIVKSLSQSISPTPKRNLGLWVSRLPTIYESDGQDQQLIDVCSEFTLLWGEPCAIGEDPQRSAKVLTEMEDGDKHGRHRLLTWLLPSIGHIACTREGCRVAQKAVEVAVGADRKALIEQLQPHILELYTSPFGNFVLSKVVEMMPSSMLGCIVEAFRGEVAVIARHRFGCRILERLIEHCSEQQLSPLLDEIVADAEKLSRHNYGNFVVQRLLEHGGPDRVTCTVRQLSSEVRALSMQRFANHVVQCALESSDEDVQAFLVGSLLGSGDLVAVACSRFGSSVVEKLADIPASCDVVRQRLIEGLQVLKASQCGRRVMEAFDLGADIEDGSTA